WRRTITLVAGVLAVALVLLVLFGGDRRRALVPLVPIALATGWSALVLFAVRVPLNPMSVTLGALVIAISTEFSVLLSERHRQAGARAGPPRPSRAGHVARGGARAAPGDGEPGGALPRAGGALARGGGLRAAMRPEPRRPAAPRYGRYVGLLALVILVLITLN